MTTPPKIETRGLAKSFGGNQVLAGVDLSLASGESLVVIGGSGSGKSVLLKCILGILTPDGGEVLVDGAPSGSGAAWLRRFGMLFQGGALFDSMPVWQNVAFRLLRDGMAAGEARALAEEKLARVGLGPRTAGLYPAELSGGMQKRVGLARAIAANPEIIFFDEPTTGLDPIMAGVINRLIRDLVSEIGATAVTITHDMSSVHAIADRVAMLNQGRVEWEGPVAALETSGNDVVDQFVHGRAEGPIPTLR
jgi:phospholipid/cholesterol/gamma-HCH transport system ATP-binding protein